MDDIPTLKASLRRVMRQRRRELAPQVREAETAVTCAAVTQCMATVTLHAVASYIAMPDELDLSAFHRSCWEKGITVWVPRVITARQLSWHALTKADDEKWLIPGAYGIREPDARFLPPQLLPADIPLLVPGLAFSTLGQRLGQGGGFYDHILSSHASKTIGIGFNCQRIDHIPCENHDQRVKTVILGGQIFSPSATAPSPTP